MSISQQQFPDYELDDVRRVSTPQGVKAMFHPLRGTVLELLLERAATVQELAAAVERPKSSVAYHVGLLASAGLLKVIRTRTVRGREERFYGRTARSFYVEGPGPERTESTPNWFVAIAAESEQAQRDDNLRAGKRYAWISDDDADEFWFRVIALVNEYAQLPRTENGVAYAFQTALYPTKHPRLPQPHDTESED
ncbi:winged helix-turn-helix domain-containing protein [Tenggerimyces flavus]|uniref:Helix-turn-helix domain-containing protein n=1 Tax=Tenggerimyces flavus TaxID=1708749 RepID=A0ABV7Y5Y3_9ACTN|nr:winged helix-turn-helix domain-containing protein [Tenggerimyces flavus]MBM7785093.1 DNA-binding transcriptional ArsR family regulator [Tenggerimyces flavus]